MTGRFHQLMCAITFCIALYLPLAYHLLGNGTETQTAEKRTLAPLPTWPSTFSAWKELPTNTNAYINDHFSFKSALVYLNSLLHYAIGVSSSEQVKIGKAGWLFYADKNDGNVIEVYRGTEKYTPDQLEIIADFVHAKKEWLAARGIPLIFVAVPNKPTIYPEYLPSSINQVSPETRLDQVRRSLTEKGDLNFVDLREPLLSAKQYGLLYRRTDTHWNALGAFVSYTAVMQHVTQYFPQVRALGVNEVQLKKRESEGGDLAKLLNLADFLRDETLEFHLLPSTQPRRKELNVLMIGDSFAHQLSPFFTKTFRKLTLMQIGGYGKLPQEWIEQNRPDLIILQMVERYI